jgi:hypothetical protein
MSYEPRKTLRRKSVVSALPPVVRRWLCPAVQGLNFLGSARGPASGQINPEG